MYFAIFDSILRHAIQDWSQHRNQIIKKKDQIQENTFRIMPFKLKNEPFNPLFQNLKKVKFKGILGYNNFVFYMTN